MGEINYVFQRDGKIASLRDKLNKLVSIGARINLQL
jgi:hypothetical protein